MTYQDIAFGVHLRSIATVHNHLYRLMARGFITVEFNKSRSIKLVPQ